MFSSELLQFYRDKTHASNDACENNEDDFVNIIRVITKWIASAIQSEKILFKVLVTI